MKSLANRLLKVVEGVLIDYTLAYPTDKKDSDRDFDRLSLLVKHRGIGLFTLDLPELDSLLLKGLQSGRLSLGCPLSRRASPKIHVPRLFRGIWLRVFDVSGSLKEDPDPTAIFFLRQLCCIGKKLEIGCTASRTRKILDEYREVEEATRPPTLGWSSDSLGADDLIDACDLIDCTHDRVGCDESVLRDERSHSADSEHINVLLRKCQRNFDAFADLLGTYNPEEFSGSVTLNSRGIGFKHGPGAVADLTGKEFKYDFPRWPAKLETLFPYNTFGVTQVSTINDGQLEFPFIRDPLPINPSILDGRFREEPASRLIAVPKTAKGPRLIACEPVAHQWCQQLTARFIIERSKTIFGTSFVTINDQEPSRRLASLSSLDGSLSTVDLSSASDRLSCWLVERAYRRNKSVLRALHSHRTRVLSDDIQGERTFVLQKFATQGTAVTFPVQSFVFLIIALTACGLDCKNPDQLFVGRGNWIDRLVGQVRVFGDDIIIPKYGYENLVSLLHTLGLKVNEQKSFSSGYFRESCGGDYFKGYDVTPVKTTSLSSTTPTSRQSLIDYSNNLFKKGLWNAAKAVESTMPKWMLKSLPVVRRDDGGVGLTSHTGTRIDHLRKRWNTSLQCHEVRMYGIRSVSRRSNTNSSSAVLQYFSEAPSPSDSWEHGIALRPTVSDGRRWEIPYFA